MYRLLQFLKRFYIIFLFIVLEGLAINYYVRSTSYTRAKLYAASNSVTGIFHNLFAGIGDYFTLRRDNRLLLERLAAVENTMSYYVEAGALKSVPHSGNKYFYSTAKVISNSITRQNNYFVINRGARDGVTENMAVLSVDGSVAGYVEKHSDNYAICMSVLNRDFRLGGHIAGRDYFGSVYWDGVSPQYVTLSDIPRYAQVEKGDSVLSAYSLRFPPDSFIGTVESYGEAGDGTYLEIKVKLGLDFMSLSDVMLVRFSDNEELDSLAGEHFQDNR